MGQPRFLPILVATLVVAGCSPSLDIPEDSKIGCDSDGDCPDGYVCKLSINRCWPAGGDDETPPGIIAAETDIDPPATTIDRSVNVSFTVSEPLLEQPTAVLGTPQRHPLTFESAAGERYHFSYLPIGTEPQEQVPVLVTLVDKSVNYATDLDIGEIRFDFTDPRFEAFNVVGASLLSAGRQGVVQFRLIEEDLNTVEVTLEDGTPLSAVADIDPPTHQYTYTPTGTEGEVPVSITLSATDVAGNTTEPETHPAFELDFTAPVVLAEPPPVVARPAVRLGQSAQVSFEVSEALGTVPTVQMTPRAGGDPVALALADKLGEEYVFTYQVGAEDLEDEYDLILIAFEDEAGNAGSEAALGEVTIDMSPPRINDLLVTPDQVSEVIGHDTLTITFELSEPVNAHASGLYVRVGTQPSRDCAPVDAELLAYRCTYTVDKDLDPEGIIGVTVEAVDAAGNGTLTGTTVQLDFSGPGLFSTDVSPTPAGVGDVVVYTVVPDEPLSAPPTLDASNGTTLPFTYRDGSSYVFEYTVVGTEAQGEYSVGVRMVDSVENITAAADATGKPFEIDSVAPEISGFSVSPDRVSRKPGFDVVTVAFTVSENVGTSSPGLAVAVGASEVTTCQQSGTGPFAYSCEYTVQAGDTEGPAEVTVKTTDAAGNADFASAGLYLDFTAPGLASGVPNPPIARADTTLVYSVTPDEPLLGPPTVTADGPASIALTYRPDSSYVFTYDVKDTDAQGAYTVSVAATDEAGNSATIVASTGFRFDTSVPVVSGLTVAPDKASRENGHDQVQIEFDLTEDVGTVAPGLQVEVGGVAVTGCLTSGSAPAIHHDCMYTISPQDTEGAYAVTVQAEDTAGNLGFASSGVTFDFTPPDLLETSVTPEAGRVGDEIVYTVTPNEPLAAVPVPEVGGAGTLVLAHQAGTEYIYRYPVVGGENDGTYTVSVPMTDEAGNPATESGVSFDLDASVPLISGLTVTPSRVSRETGHDQVRIELDVTEDVGTDAPGFVVEVGGIAVTGCIKSGTAPNVHYDCTYTVRLADTQGDKAVTVQAMDAAGNLDFASGSVRFDFTPPGLLASQARPPAGKVGDEILYTITPDEALAGPPDLTVGGAGTFDFVHVTDTEYIYRYPVAGGEGDGTFTVSIYMTDLAGNPATEGGATFDLDSSIPQITPDTLLTDNPRDATIAGQGHRVTATFTVSEALPADPAVTIEGLPMTRQGGATAPYTFFYDVTAGDEDGEKRVVVRTSDAAGNEDSEQLGTILFDITDPAVVPGSESVQLVPDAGNPLFVVTEVAAGTTVRVSFTVTETLGPDPTVQSLSGAPPDITLTKTTSAGNFYQYEYLADGTEPEQTHTLQAVLEDLAGNVSLNTLTLPHPGLVVDTSAPVAPDVNTLERIVYTRTPWGTHDSGGSPEFGVTGKDNAVEASVGLRKRWVVVYSPLGSEVGRAEVSDTGSFDIGLVPTDWSRVSLQAVDGAGNALPAVDVRDVAWTATMGHKVRGSSLENPHVVSTTGLLAPFLVQPPGSALEASEADIARLATVEGDEAGSLVRAAEQIWQQRADGTNIGQRYGHRGAFDTARGILNVFSGRTVSFLMTDESWEWDVFARRWTDVTPAGTKPDARWMHAMAYDAARDRIVMFGGDIGSGRAGDTWEWNPATRSWTDVTPTGSNPVARYGHTMVYDPDHRNIVMIAGDAAPADGGTIRDTWLWDGDAKTWTWLDLPLHKMPFPRRYHAAAYDTDQRRVLVYGGVNSSWNGIGVTDLWEFDGDLQEWVKVEPVIGGPGTRAWHGMAYDELNHELVLFGGWDTATKKNDTWVFDRGTMTWTDVTPASNNPPVRQNMVMFYDPIQQRVVMSGGMDNSGNGIPDLWAWDGGARTWTNITPSSTAPSGRRNSSMVYDADGDRSVLFGGYDSAPRQDTWLWDSTTGHWRDATPGGTKPDARSVHEMVYDTDRARVILFGGYVSAIPAQDTWLWGTAGEYWFEMTPGGTNPDANIEHALAFDSDRNKMVLFGGQYDGRTWEWESPTNTWEEVAPAVDSPESRADHVMAFDPDQREVVLFGGRSNVSGDRLGDTLVWDGVARTWSDVSPAGDSPEIRWGATMVWDSARRKVLLFSGTTETSGTPPDTWEWDGRTRTWTEVTATGNKPSGRVRHAMAYDSVAQRAVIYGGDSLEIETWEWISAADRRGATLWQVSWAAAGAGNLTPREMIARAYAGGEGHTAEAVPARIDGADLLIWNHRLGAWRSLGSNTDPIASPALIEPPPLDANELADVLLGTPRALNLAVTPAGTNGAGMTLGRVAVDYLEVTIEYRFP